MHIITNHIKPYRAIADIEMCLEIKVCFME